MPCECVGFWVNGVAMTRFTQGGEPFPGDVSYYVPCYCPSSGMNFTMSSEARPTIAPSLLEQMVKRQVYS